MKKTIWVVLPILVIAVVLVSVFAIQKNSLTVEVSRLQADNADLSRHVEEMDIAVKTAKELAETMVQETKAELSAVTAERDELKVTTENAAAQLNEGIRQLKTTLSALGVEDTEASMAAELKETKAALSAVTEERDALLAAAENARIEKTVVAILNAEGDLIRQLDPDEELNLSDLAPGEYIITVTALTKDDTEAIQYAFPYAVPTEEEKPTEEEAEDQQGSEEPADQEQETEEAQQDEPSAADAAEEIQAASQEEDPAPEDAPAMEESSTDDNAA